MCNQFYRADHYPFWNGSSISKCQCFFSATYRWLNTYKYVGNPQYMWMEFGDSFHSLSTTQIHHGARTLGHFDFKWTRMSLRVFFSFGLSLIRKRQNTVVCEPQIYLPGTTAVSAWSGFNRQWLCVLFHTSDRSQFLSYSSIIAVGTILFSFL